MIRSEKAYRFKIVETILLMMFHSLNKYATEMQKISPDANLSFTLIKQSGLLDYSLMNIIDAILLYTVQRSRSWWEYICTFNINLGFVTKVLT